jgi:hypothetical protein
MIVVRKIPFFFFVLLFFLLYFAKWAATEPNYKVVIWEGIGIVKNLNYAKAKDMAFCDAISNVIEQAVESLIPMGNKVKNYLLLKEYIYPKALNYINKYKFISEKWDKRYYRIIIQAQVDLGYLKGDLINFRIVSKKELK